MEQRPRLKQRDREVRAGVGGKLYVKGHGYTPKMNKKTCHQGAGQPVKKPARYVPLDPFYK